MQTFLPLPGLSASARVLDRARLGKQRVECKQIYLALTDPAYGWQNHPAVRMWKGHELALAHYGLIICGEWRSRGYKDTLMPWFDNLLPSFDSEVRITMPSWFGEPTFHLSHRSNLLRKQPAWYRTFWPDDPDDLPYIWPIPVSCQPTINQ